VWSPAACTVLRCAVQELLDTPNNQSPAQILGRDMLRYQPAEYKVKVWMQAKQYAPKE
jgi:ubiquitin-protein ligase